MPTMLAGAPSGVDSPAASARDQDAGVRECLGFDAGLAAVGDFAPADVTDTVLSELWDGLAGLRSAATRFDTGTMSGDDAAEVVKVGVALERLGALLRTRFALRVEATGAYRTTGHKNAAGWLAEQSGESVGQAHGVLKAASQLADAPVVADAFADGRLSLAQAAVAADAGVLVPTSQGRLVATAATGSLRELKTEAARIKRKAHGEASVLERDTWVQRRRYCRFWSPAAGGVRLEAWLPTVDGARLKAVLQTEADRIFEDARVAGVRDRSDAHLADALVRVVCGDGQDQPKAGVTVRANVAGLRRAFVDGDETCEIPGVGPVPVAVILDLLGDSAFRVVTEDGGRAATSATRTSTSPCRPAPLRRDGTCAVPGCQARWMGPEERAGPQAQPSS
jgi:hypothetical protein